MIDRFNPGCPDPALSIIPEWPVPGSAEGTGAIKSHCLSVSVGFGGIPQQNLLPDWRGSKNTLVHKFSNGGSRTDLLELVFIF